MTRARHESAMSGVMNGKSFPIRLPICHWKLVRTSMVAFALAIAVPNSAVQLDTAWEESRKCIPFPANNPQSRWW